MGYWNLGLPYQCTMSGREVFWLWDIVFTTVKFYKGSKFRIFKFSLLILVTYCRSTLDNPVILFMFWTVFMLPVLSTTTYIYQFARRSSGGRVVKLLAFGAKGPGFDSRPRHLNFQRLVISCFQVAIWLKYRWSDVIPQYNQPTNQFVRYLCVSPSVCLPII